MEHSDNTEQDPQDFTHIREVLYEYLEEGAFELDPEPRSLDGYLGEIEFGLGPTPRSRSTVLTGFHDLDTLLGGLRRSELIILASRPSLGKSSLALNIARNAALGQGARIIVFSPETGKQQVVQGLLSTESSVDTTKFRLGEFTAVEQVSVIESIGRLAKAPIYIDDSPFLPITELCSKAMHLHQENAIDLIIVDYLGLMLQRGDDNVSEMSEISRSLKRLARVLDVPLLALTHLSRAPEHRDDHRPRLSDLRESGSIEQDADVVMFIYRGDKYYTEQQWSKLFTDSMYPKGLVEVVVSKNRNGPTGTIELRFTDHIAKFEPLPR